MSWMENSRLDHSPSRRVVPSHVSWVRPNTSSKGLSGHCPLRAVYSRRPLNVSIGSEPNRIELSHPALRIAFVIGNRFRWSVHHVLLFLVLTLTPPYTRLHGPLLLLNSSQKDSNSFVQLQLNDKTKDAHREPQISHSVRHTTSSSQTTWC